MLPQPGMFCVVDEPRSAPAPRTGAFLRRLLDADQNDGRTRLHDSSMERIDWTHALSLAATLALAVGAGVLLSGSGADLKAAAATAGATKGTSNKLGAALDDVVATLLRGVHDAIDQRINGWVGEVKSALGAPVRTEVPSSMPARAD